MWIRLSLPIDIVYIIYCRFDIDLSFDFSVKNNLRSWALIVLIFLVQVTCTVAKPSSPNQSAIGGAMLGHNSSKSDLLCKPSQKETPNQNGIPFTWQHRKNQRRGVVY